MDFLKHTDFESVQSDIETLESEIEALRSVIQAIEYSTAVVHADFDRTCRKAAHNLLCIIVHRIRFQQCRSSFRNWWIGVMQDHNQHNANKLQDQFSTTEQVLNQAVQALQSEYKSRVAAVEKEAHAEIMLVRKTSAEEQDYQRRRWEVAQQAQQYAQQHARSQDALSDTDSVSDIDISSNLLPHPDPASLDASPDPLASPSPSLSLGSPQSPVDVQLVELKGMLDKLMEFDFE